jgi:transcriptional regulator with XRE-family HTH domain
MGDPGGPTVRRRRLVIALRKLREQSGLSAEQAGAALGIAGTTIWRLETGRTRSIKVKDVVALCHVYDADPETAAALTTLARGGQARGWWEKLGAADTGWLKMHRFDTFVELEADATQISTYENELVPGLLQTEAYAREITRTTLMLEDPDDIDTRVHIRMARQQVLDRIPPLRLWAVLNESVLRRVVGSAALMREQLDALLHASRRTNVTIQVLPFTAGSHPASVGGAFIVLGFEQTDLDVVYLDNQTGALYLEEPDDIDRYNLILDHTRARALNPDESLKFIAAIAKSI